MSRIRTLALAASAALVVVHIAILMARYGTATASLWGDVLSAVAAPLLGAVMAWYTARESSAFGARVWRLVAFSLLLAFVGGVFYTYLFDIQKARPGLWPSDLLVFFWPVPALMTLFLSPRDPNSGFRWLRVCDFTQICTLVLSVELSQLYVPSRWETSEPAMAVRALYAGLAVFGLNAFSFLVRGLRAALGTARTL